MIFEIETETEGREVFCVEADSAEDARGLLERGDVTKPLVSEVTGSSVVRVTPSTADDCG